MAQGSSLTVREGASLLQTASHGRKSKCREVVNIGRDVDSKHRDLKSIGRDVYCKCRWRRWFLLGNIFLTVRDEREAVVAAEKTYEQTVRVISAEE